jgi:hypothetical protein
LAVNDISSRAPKIMDNFGMKNWRSVTLAIGLALLAAQPALAQKYDTGASDTEIKLGQTMPYSGPASSFAPIGRSG